jgi:hypothetical protein
MNPLIPTPDVLPAAWGYFQFLLMLTFPLHLLAMNAMLGTALISLLARVRGGPAHIRLAHDLAKMLPLIVAFTINLGVAPLLFVQVLYGHFLYTSSVLMAVYWLGVPLVLIIAYYAVYLYDFKFEALGRWGIAPIALVLAVFLGIAFIFTNNMTLMLEPGRWTAYFSHRDGTVLNLGSPTLWPRYLHNVIGGMAVGGLFVAAFGKFKASREPQVGELAVRMGLKVFTTLTMAEVLIGFWFLMSLPLPVMTLFMGGSPLATGLLGAGVLLALLALAAGSRGNVVLGAGLTVPLVFVMAFMRDAVRAGTLKPVFTPATLKVVPQVSPMIMFALTLVGGIAVIAWMLWQTFQVRDGA